MTERDRSAERRVAAFISQNMPAPKEKSEQAVSDDLFTAAAKDRKRSRLPQEFLDTAPSARGSATSHEAAETIGASRRPKAFLVYHHIKSLGKYGATRQETVDATGISLQTVCSLVRQLYQMGLIGSNCIEGCRWHCEHKPVSRRNRFSALDNEVMLHEDHVVRWQQDQARPPKPPKWRTT
jgi:hypothetical protein